MSDKVKKTLPYIIVNLTGAALAVLSYFFGIMTTPVGYVLVISFLPILLIRFLQLEFFAVIILVTILNIAAFIFIVHDKSIAGLIFAIFCGSSLGAFIGTLANYNFKYAKIVRLIFNINIWLCIGGFCSIYYIASYPLI
ncbi:MAG: hypothetical protein K2J11_03575 [Oscillospiraceae bacterium]|nr:hypothetical protein [Oscillospiraceae bacterium]